MSGSLAVVPGEGCASLSVPTAEGQTATGGRPAPGPGVLVMGFRVKFRPGRPGGPKRQKTFASAMEAVSTIAPAAPNNSRDGSEG